MRQFWIRLKSKTPKWAKKAQIFFASLAAFGGTVLVMDTSPEWAKEASEHIVFTGGALAAFAQFVISNTSKNADKVDSK